MHIHGRQNATLPTAELAMPGNPALLPRASSEVTDFTHQVV
jgi:hypothetical protein